MIIYQDVQSNLVKYIINNYQDYYNLNKLFQLIDITNNQIISSNISDTTTIPVTFFPTSRTNHSPSSMSIISISQTIQELLSLLSTALYEVSKCIE